MAPVPACMPPSYPFKIGSGLGVGARIGVRGKGTARDMGRGGGFTGPALIRSHVQVNSSTHHCTQISKPPIN
jgi:hypothetical protein